MHTLPPHRRLLLLTEGQLGIFTAKTAAALLRYRAADVVAVLDSAAAGTDLRAAIPWAPPVPIIARVSDAAPLRPDALYVGIAPVGGALPPEMRAHIRAALAAGLDVVSGLHEFLADDAELADLAARRGTRLFDVRRPPTDRVVASTRARDTRCRRVLTVGTECNVGKMVTALELTAAARRAGRAAAFAATGQTGIMIAGRGVCVDACIADFAAGAVETLVLNDADADVCFIEGQGSIAHPGFSPVTLALLHGACPHALVLVHQLGRTHYRAPPFTPLPPWRDLIHAYEHTTALVHPTRVVGVALNTVGHSDDDARAAAAALEAELGLPVQDPIRDGCDRLLAAALA